MKKLNPLVSIIIPIYNEEEYLDYCLLSLTKQSYRNFEIILIDDGSNDKSVEIAKKYHVKFYTQKHQGPGVARNLGVKKAIGEILCFLDADMKYDREYIKKLISPIQNKKAIGTFNIEYVANKDNIWSKCWSINSDLLPGQRTGDERAKTSNIFRAILKSEFEKSGGFNSSLGYADDTSIADKLGKKSILAEGAIAYHYNPEHLLEIFYSARWIGRSIYFKRNIINLLRFSVFNSIRIISKKIINGAPIQFIVFKIIYDLGVFSGIFLSYGKKEK